MMMMRRVLCVLAVVLCCSCGYTMTAAAQNSLPEGRGAQGGAVNNNRGIYHPGVSDLDVIYDVLKLNKTEVQLQQKELSEKRRAAAKGPKLDVTLQMKADGLGAGGVDSECRTGTTDTHGKCSGTEVPRTGENEKKGWDVSNEDITERDNTKKRYYHPGVSDLDAIYHVLNLTKDDIKRERDADVARQSGSVRQVTVGAGHVTGTGSKPGGTLQTKEEDVHHHGTSLGEGQLETQNRHERQELGDPESALQQTKDTRENENLVQEDREVARPSVPAVGEPESIPVVTTSKDPSPTEGAESHSAPEGTPESERTENPPTGEHSTEEVDTNQTNPQSQSESTPTTSQETNTTTPPSTENTTTEAPTETPSPVPNPEINTFASTVQKNKGNVDSSLSPVWMRTAAPLLIVAVLFSATVY
ncbi:uncharacterized protein TM35_000571140 [Trypanosoma theileri]|uniref:Mucin-associated surface protein (MASP) n=1 Tax=Trypanosoma theileri TaxID=67003 RepID=A0A1X0NGF2_9TRYP|nr:uncharacterized protein TM35_000571140 [Trypanosoma theileri]ORC83786.1 hypothetical protein TM35_000571140 [Trypanosoma theileri]